MESVVEMRNIENFLKDQHRVGQDSAEGTFTVNPERAREKMREFQLANPGSYVCKIVQAAVSGGARSIDIKVAKREFTVTFEATHPELLSPQPLLENFRHTHALSESPMRHLAVGLQAAPRTEVVEIRWETPGGALILTDAGLTTEPHQRNGQRLIVKKKSKLLGWFRGTSFLHETQALIQRCGYNDCPIRLDNRLLRQNQWDNFAADFDDDIGLTPNTRPINLLEVKQNETDGFVINSVDWDQYDSHDDSEYYLSKLEGSAEKDGPVLHSKPDAPQPEGLRIAIRPSLREIGHLALIKHGILLEVKDVDIGHPGAAVLCLADNLRTDLSEFKCVEDETFWTRLEEIRQIVRTMTERVSDREIKRFLAIAGFQGQQLETRRALISHLFQFHDIPAPTTLMAHVEACFPHSFLQVSPNISPEIETNVREIHQAHLPPGEALLAVYDDTILGNAKTGFVLTRYRLCWKDRFLYPQYVLWDNLSLENLSFEDGKVKLMQTDFCFTSDDSMRRLVRFLEGIPQLKLKSGFQLSEIQRTIIESTLSHLGKRRGLFLYPYIPKTKLEVAKKSFDFQDDGDGDILVLYDDTMFGGGENGFALTAKRLYWRNVLDEASDLSWPQIAKTKVEATSSGVRIGEQNISIYRADFRHPVASLFRTLAPNKIFTSNEER